MPTEAETKQIYREVILEWKAKGAPETADEIDNIVKSLMAFKGISVDSKKSLETFVAALSHAAKTSSASSADIEKLTKKLEELTKNLDKNRKISKETFNSFENGLKKLLSPINALGAALGAGGISMSGMLQTTIKLNKELLSGSGSWAKYGIGVAKFEKGVIGISNKIKLTQTETMSLLKTFEKTFNRVSFQNAETILNNIKNIVGANVNAMQEYLSMLGSVVNKFPDLERSITRLSSLDKGRLSLINQQLVLSGQMSLDQAKQFQDYILNNKQANSEDEKRKQQLQEQIDVVQRLAIAFEQVSKAIGNEIMPYIKDVVAWIEKGKDGVVKWAKVIAGVAAGYVAIKTTLGAINTLQQIQNVLLGKKGSILSGSKSLFSKLRGPKKISGASGKNVFGKMFSTLTSQFKNLFSTISKYISDLMVKLSGGRLAGSGGKILSSLGVLGKAGSTVGRFATGGFAAGAGVLLSGAAAGYGTGKLFDYGAEKMFGIDPNKQSNKVKGIKATTMVGAGAATGAALGSVIPVVGTAIGAALGGIGGGLAAFFQTTKAGKDTLHVLGYAFKKLWSGIKSFGSFLGKIATTIGSAIGSVAGFLGKISGISWLWDKFSSKIAEVSNYVSTKEKEEAESNANAIRNDSTFKDFNNSMGIITDERQKSKEKSDLAGDITNSKIQNDLLKIGSGNSEISKFLIDKVNEGQDKEDVFDSDEGKALIEKRENAYADVLKDITESYEDAKNRNDDVSLKYYESLNAVVNAQKEYEDAVRKKEQGLIEQDEVDAAKKNLNETKSKGSGSIKAFEDRQVASIQYAEERNMWKAQQQAAVKSGEIQGLKLQALMLGGNSGEAFRQQQEIQRKITNLDTSSSNTSSYLSDKDRDVIVKEIGGDSEFLNAGKLSLNSKSLNKRYNDLNTITQRKENAQNVVDNATDINEKNAAQAKLNSLIDIEAKMKKDISKIEEERSVVEAEAVTVNGYILASLNEQKMILESQNKLYESQVGVLDSIIGKYQTAGDINRNELNKGIKDSIDTLKEKTATAEENLRVMEQATLKEKEMFREQNRNTLAKFGITDETSGEDLVKKSKEIGDAVANTSDKEEAEELLEISKKLNKLGVSDLENAAARNNLEAQRQNYLKTALEIVKKTQDAYKGQLDYANALIDNAEIQIQLADTLGSGIKASVEMRMLAIKAVGDQIAIQKEELAAYKAALANAGDDIAKTIAAKENIVRIENEITKNIMKQAEMSKSIRDGYVSAVMAMTAGSGMFNKILITQEKNMSTGLRTLGVVTSKTSGGLYGGAQYGSQYTQSGLADGDRSATGYDTYAGTKSSMEPGQNLRDEATKQIEKLTQNATKGNNIGGGISSNPNNLGAYTQPYAGSNESNLLKQEKRSSNTNDINRLTKPYENPATSMSSISNENKDVSANLNLENININISMDGINKLSAIIQQEVSKAINRSTLAAYNKNTTPRSAL